MMPSAIKYFAKIKSKFGNIDPARLNRLLPAASHKWFAAGSVATIAGFGYAIFIGTQTHNKPVHTYTVRIFALGIVQPTEYIREITNPMQYKSSRVIKLFVDENDYVQKGSPLYTVEDSLDAFYNKKSSQFELRQIRAQLQSSENQANSSRIARDYYQKQFYRYKKLADEGAATREESLQNLTLYKAADQKYKSDLALVNAQKELLESTDWKYRANSFRSAITTIRAPSNVKVFKIYSREGESVNQGRPIMDIGDIDSMGVLAEVHRIDIRNIKIGQSVTISANGMPYLKWKGKVIQIGSQIKTQSLQSDDPSALRGNHVFDVLIKLDPVYSLQASNYNNLEVNVTFDPL